MKTVKTAGTSVETYFEKYCLPEGEWSFIHSRPESICDAGIIGYRGLDAIGAGATYFNHMSAVALRNAVGQETWDQYFKFTVIRNPFDKLVSAYFHFVKNAENGKDAGEEIDDVVRFRRWIQDGPPLLDRHTYTIDGDVCIDYLMRYENLVGDLAYVCDKIGVPFQPEGLRRLKSGIRDTRLKVSDFYDAQTMEVVSDAYAFELENFGYEFPVD